MRDLNKVLLIGRVGRKPEARTTGRGVRLAVFSLATSRRRAKVRAMGVAGGGGVVGGAGGGGGSGVGGTVGAGSEAAALEAAGAAGVVASANGAAAGGNGVATAANGVAQSPAERPDWHQVVAWGTLARIVEDHLRVGQPLLVEGTIHNNSYMVTDKDGVKHPRKSSEIWADDIRFLDRSRQSVDAAVAEAEAAVDADVALEREEARHAQDVGDGGVVPVPSAAEPSPETLSA